MTPASTPTASFAAELARLRRAGPLALDLDRWSPAECGLPGVPAPALDDADAAARAAVTSYLAAHGASLSPDQVVLAGSEGAARALVIAALVRPGEALLVPAGERPVEGPAGWPPGVEPLPYALRYDGAWRLDPRALRRALTPRVRAVLVGNPAHPTGAVPGEAAREALEALCAEHGLALLADERLLDVASGAPPSLAAGRRVLTVHLSGLASVTGCPDGPGWAALTGPEALVAPALRRLREVAGPSRAGSPDWTSALRALPAVLDGREAYLGPLRRRLAGNRSHLEVSALREAPWSVLESGGGLAAVLQIGAAWRAEAVALRLLAEGVVVRPGSLCGLPGEGLLVLSLLTDPVVFDQGLERLERLLRGGDAP